jgi:hypothetical protein
VGSRAAEERVRFFLLERSWPISIYEMGFFVLQVRDCSAEIKISLGWTEMILKNKDPRTEDIKELNRLLTIPLKPRQKSLVQQELRILQAGERNEESAAYFLNFHLKDSKNWMVLHDLRIEHRGKVAQIDHLVINRFLYVYVLESKSFAYGVKITPEGEFLRWDRKEYHGIESPIEQNKRHIFALEQSVKDRDLAPNRLGFSIPVTYRNVVMISPKSQIIRPDGGTDDGSVIKADAFWTYAQKEVDKVSFLEAGKIISATSVNEFGERLSRLHRPSAGMNYMAKFGISADGASSPAPINVVASPPAPAYSPAPDATATSGRRCDGCAVQVESKVVAFCRFNKAKFDGKILCRECQQKIGGNFGVDNIQRPAMRKLHSAPGLKTAAIETRAAPLAAKIMHGVQPAQQATAGISPLVPTCPACNVAMIKRQAKKGPNAGGWFWACTEYPKCRKVLAVEVVR